MAEMEKLVRNRFERFGAAGDACSIKVIPLGDMARRYADGALEAKKGLIGPTRKGDANYGPVKSIH